jgi:transcriptional regulator with XRE-family HTH domain
VNGDDRVTADATADATARRKQLGRLLRRAREQAKLTQKAVSAELACGQAKINKIETQLVKVSPAELETLIDLYRLPREKADELRELAELDRLAGPQRTKHMSAFSDLSELELEAREIRCWHSERIPGPLQSELYVIRQHEPLPVNDAAALTLMLRERRARTKVFTVTRPPRYRVILSESSLHRMPGGRTTQMVVDQTEHLLKLIDTYEQLELQILTFDADLPYVDSDFQHLTFDDPGKCEFAYIEYPGGSRKCKTPQELAACSEHWAALSAAALDLKKSREFLNELAGRDRPSTF